jgi:branched-subunit amino acid aminotransferase/4-amino-4-deoxychorismate lyase
MLAYLNGQWIDYANATIAPWDYGFTMGATATEQLRTFGGQLADAAWHVDRLLGGLDIMGLPIPLERDQLLAVAQEVVTRNWAEVPAGGDMGVGLCVSPGYLTKFSPAGIASDQPTVLAYGYPLNFDGLSELYSSGMALTIVETREIPDACVPKTLKNRSRMHYYLAEQEAAAKSPGSRALLLDLDGNVAEATVATVAIVEQDTIVVPPAAAILPGTALRYLINLCDQENVRLTRESISPARLKAADEVLWLSTPVAMLPVTRVDTQPIGNGNPGPIFKAIIAAWSREIGIDIVAQATGNPADGQSPRFKNRNV